MVDMLAKTGVMGIALGVLFFLALALFIERWLSFRREATDMEMFSGPFTEAVEALRFDEAAQICEMHTGHVAEVFRVAVQHYGQGAATLRNVLGGHIELIVIPRLRARMKFLGAIGRGAPMIGLLGTVYGMMQAFVKIASAQGQGADAKQLAGDIGMALGTTFLGLIVAVPIVFGMAYLRGRIDQFEIDLERYTNHCVDLLYSTAPTNEVEATLASGVAAPLGEARGGTEPVESPPAPLAPSQPIRRQT